MRLHHATIRTQLELLERRRLLSFGAESIYAVTANPLALATADFNGDGRADLVTANGQSNSFSVLLGNANGTFQPALISIASPDGEGTGPITVLPGDFTGDGKFDLVTLITAEGWSLSHLGLSRGNGNGTFQVVQYIDLPAPTAVPPGAVGPFWQGPISVAAGDMNADGKLDLVALGWATFNIPTGDYEEPYRFITRAYANVLLGNGNGGVTTGSVVHLADLLNGNLTVADFNSDNKQDLFIAQSDAAYVMLGNGSGALATAARSSVPLLSAYIPFTGDVDHDSKRDALFLGNGVITLLKGLGNGTFSPQSQNTTLSAGSYAAGDVNGDAKLDVISVSSSFQSSGVDPEGYPIDPVTTHHATVLPGLGDGSFGVPSATFTLGSYAGEGSLAGAILKDFNGDSRLDVAAFDFNNGKVSASLNDGNRATKSWTGPTTGGNWSTASNWSPSGVPTASDLVSIAGKSVILSASATFASLTLTGGASLTVTSNGSRVLRVGELSIAADSSLNLTDNDLILDYSGVSPVGAWTGTAYDGVTGMIQSGRVTSSLASGNLKSFGVAEAREALGITGSQTATFAGQAVDSTSVLVKFTWGGDATLDGRINIDDYGRIDGNVAQSGSVFGYVNGDFNLDGKINVDDYGIIDGNINQQDEIP